MASFEPDDRLRPLLAFVPLDDAAKHDLCARMSDASRHYHGIDHLALLWARHERYAAAAGLRTSESDCRIACALAYHDAIYDVRRHDNEERSAELWLTKSRNCRISDDTRAWVAETIRATGDHLAYALDILRASQALPVTERARLWLLDLDLTPLGENPDVFDANTERLRAESSDLPDADFDRRRFQFLERFANAAAIYRSPVLSEVFEDRARANLRRQLDALRATCSAASSGDRSDDGRQQAKPAD